MKRRLPYISLLASAIAVWWISDHKIIPWIQNIFGYELIQDKGVSILLGHWIFGQLPRVIMGIMVWLTGMHFGLMPSFARSLGFGKSFRQVVNKGLISSAVLLVLTFAVGFAAGGKFGFHPYLPKMAGDLVSNMYEEIIYRGLMFCSFYGVAAAESFPLTGSLNKAGIILGTIGSSFIFAAGHEQYSISLQFVIGILSVVFAYAWFTTRSLWAPWIAHTIVDIVGDTFIKL